MPAVSRSPADARSATARASMPVHLSIGSSGEVRERRGRQQFGEADGERGASGQRARGLPAALRAPTTLWASHGRRARAAAAIGSRSAPAAGRDGGPVRSCAPSAVWAVSGGRGDDVFVEELPARPRSHRLGLRPTVTVERDVRDQHWAFTAVVLGGIAGALIMARLGVPPLDLHSPLHHVGVMDPLCGMTRATAALGRAELATAWRYNPGVFLLAAAAAVALVRVAVAAVTGTWWWARVRGWPVWVAGLGGGVALEVNQQLHAGLLR